MRLLIQCEVPKIKIKKTTTLAAIALTITALALTVTTLAVLSSNQTVPLNGTISAVNLGVYTDSACTQNATALNVGELTPGGSTTQIVYIKNTGNVPETLTMAVTNWNPTQASSSLTLTWDQQNVVLDAGEVVEATLTLDVGVDTGSITSFSCDVTFTGTQ